MKIIGIDPGTKNTGICILDTETKNPLKTYKVEGNIDKLLSIFEKEKADLVVIERYVQYGNHQTDHEKVNRLIGALELLFKLKNIPVKLVKAIEWQYYLRKILKHKKEKSYKKLAKQLFNINFNTEHEADAYFLSLYGYYKIKEY